MAAWKVSARRAGFSLVASLVLPLSFLAIPPTPSRAQQRGDGKQASKASKAAAAERKKAVDRWKKSLQAVHDKGFHQRGREAAERLARAEAELDEVSDAAAVPAIWAVFAGKAGHHSLMVRMLGRIDTAESTGMLAAVSVYSDDAKARLDATAALESRDPKDFAGELIRLIQAPLRYKKSAADLPGVGRAQVLLVEDERVDYKFLYPAAERPPAPQNKAYVFDADNPYMTREARKQAQAMNKAQMEQARQAIAEQVNSDIEQIQRINRQIAEIKDRAVGVLRRVSGRQLPPDREAWRRWLSERQGTTYEPTAKEPKETLAVVVPHLYQPSFIRIPAPT